MLLTMTYFSLGMQSNAADDEIPTVIFFGLIKIESSFLVLFCSLDILILPKKFKGGVYMRIV